MMQFPHVMLQNYWRQTMTPALSGGGASSPQRARTLSPAMPTQNALAHPQAMFGAGRQRKNKMGLAPNLALRGGF